MIRRIAFGFLAVALVMSVTAGCAASPSVAPSASATPPSDERISYAYDMRLGETEPGTEAGTFNRSIYVPAFSSGVWLRMSTLDGTFTRDVCQVAITDTVESSSDACTVEVYERDERGMLQGVVLHVNGLDEAGYFETDARELRRNREGGWDGETAGRSVKLWGYLTPEGEK